MIKAKVENKQVDFEIKGNIICLTQDLLNIILTLYEALPETQRQLLELALKSEETWDAIKERCREEERVD